ncbi:alpha/beta fold hydrolase [Noviherbaspirillum sp. CPCC 100848]|uniref:Alpha/beta fold hydrolase n=1 Tax=Noviherbaspirillum album TaxID=3080276 RepID=A0ABU6J9I8_9BURK|nr:alpha/beta fold hydrolase [Noviherbaspirillum sp. CPCC 100848]MEC4720323.1 alpha/beta fold hydrolase [Noviherbaspirillum sp. CPCC 100848]
MKYLPPSWLPGGHLQTIYPATCATKPAVAYRRERWPTPDGDFIDLDFVDGQPGQPFVVLFHGLEGSSDSHYARGLMAHLQTLGWWGAVPHFRGCSGEPNHAPRFYHSGDAGEVDWIIRRLHDMRRQQHAGTKFYAAGVSLGGNALLRWLGESQHQADFVDAACAISAPLDLAGGGAALSKGVNMIYTRVFLQTLKPKCLHKLSQFPGLFDRDRMLGARNLYEFDNIVTAPLHGYRDTDDYWNRASARHILDDITVPTLVLNARNDPFLPARHLPQSAAPCVTLEYPEHGGHVGFAVGGPPGRLHWLPRRITAFLQAAG